MSRRVHEQEEHMTTSHRRSIPGILGTVPAAALALGGALSLAALPTTAHADTWPVLTTEDLVANDYVLYFANAGAAVTDSVAPGDHLGLYQTLTDQPHGTDARTGMSWGYVENATSVPTANANSTDVKNASLRYDAKPSSTPEGDYERRHVSYAFDLPEGHYDVTVGYNMPSNWATRTMDLYLEDVLWGPNTARSGTDDVYLAEAVHVTDGTLDVRVNSQLSRTNPWHDPVVGWIEVRARAQQSLAELAALVELRTLAADERERYAPETAAPLDDALAAAGALIEAGEEDATAITAAYAAIEQAWAGLRELVHYESFRPGQPWVDDNGRVIQAHGGQVVPVEGPDGSTVYHWYGEDRTHGYQPMSGLHGYSSDDLYNWRDEGLVLRTAESREQLDTDEYFAELYADYTDVQKDIVYLDLDSLGTTYDHGRAIILERPKVMYNEATDQWVLWVHADGPTPWSDAQYAKATAGVAVSDGPFGPFRYVDSYRLHYIPADDPDNRHPSQLGMARDMTVFTDTDGTGYIVYSSEENQTMYVSRLDASYTFVDVEPDSAVLDEDFSRSWPGAWREAPAMFRYEETYYLITSGATGWDPNPAAYGTADNPLGPWTLHGNPATAENGGIPATTHGSQSTAVIPIDAEAGKFIYMGDRWTPSDLANSPYVWLPLEFGEGTQLMLPWLAEWTLADLENRGRVTYEADLPDQLVLGDTSALPETIQVTSSGATTEVAVDWHTGSIAAPGVRELTGTYEAGGGQRDISVRIPVLPAGITHLVDAGGDGSGADYLALAEAAGTISEHLVTSVADQAYAPDPQTGHVWGHTGATTESSSSDAASWTASLRYVLSTAPDRSLEYRFSGLEAGEHLVYAGYYDPWAEWANDRRAQVWANDTLLEASRPITGAETVGTYHVTVDEDGDLRFRLTPIGSGDGTDVQLSWLVVARAG